MSFYNEDPRLSQARTDSSYATASPRPGFLPPLAQSNLSIGQSIPSTPRDSTAGGYDGYAEREPLAAPGYGSAARLPTVPKEANEGSPFIGSQAYAAAPNAYATPDDSFLYEVRKPWYKRPLPPRWLSCACGGRGCRSGRSSRAHDAPFRLKLKYICQWQYELFEQWRRQHWK